MKKKQIEAIPYLGLPGVVRKKEVKYAAVTARLEIGGEAHIFLEVYRNRADSKTIPVIRYAATAKDWGIYEPGTGAWSRAGITSNTWGRVLYWYGQEDSGIYIKQMEMTELFSGEDLERIRGFFRDAGRKEQRITDWPDYFERNEEQIRQEAADRKNKRRQQALAERQENTPPLPEKELLAYADRELFRQQHYLFYRKKGRKASLCCSACGGVYGGRWKAGESYESQMCGKYIMEPVEGQTGGCLLCGARGTYRPQGKAVRLKPAMQYLFLADRYRETGAVVRYLQMEKEWILEEAPGERGKPEMAGACEKISGIEIARTYFQKGKKTQTDYHKHSYYDGKDFWDDCNLYGLSNINIQAARIHPDTWENLKGTILQYSALREYAAAAGGEANAADYLERYLQYPQIEMLVKMRLYGVVKEMVDCRLGCVAMPEAKRADLFLGIRRDKVKLLSESRGDTGILRILQMEMRMGQNWTENQVRALAEIRIIWGDLDKGLRLMGVQKLLNLIEKYAGCAYGTGCSAAQERLRSTAVTYFDYLDMREARGYDLHNTVYQRPRDLRMAHALMVAETHKEEMDRRLKEVAERFPEIRKKYRALRKKYFYEDETFTIRPAKSAEEIVLEGRILHHCVGGDNYLGKHNSGETYILMLRFREEPDIPYITVEIDGHGRILQWYGAQDKKPDQQNMQRWLDTYLVRLKCGGTKDTGETEPGIGLGTQQGLLVAAG